MYLSSTAFLAIYWLQNFQQ